MATKKRLQVPFELELEGKAEIACKNEVRHFEMKERMREEGEKTQRHPGEVIGLEPWSRNQTNNPVGYRYGGMKKSSWRRHWEGFA